MSADTPSEPELAPLVVEFEVIASIEHAFDTWSHRASLWWPSGHTQSGSPSRIVFEPEAGGRIYEVGPNGDEHAWGEVIEYRRPNRIRSWWHLFFDRSEATIVDVSFEPTAAGTRVRLVQTGWDSLGEAGAPRRDRTAGAWAQITERFGAAVASIPVNDH